MECLWSGGDDEEEEEYYPGVIYKVGHSLQPNIAYSAV